MTTIRFRRTQYTFNKVPTKRQQGRLRASLYGTERLRLALFGCFKIMRWEAETALMKNSAFVLKDGEHIGIAYPQGFTERLTLTEKLGKRYYA